MSQSGTGLFYSHCSSVYSDCPRFYETHRDAGDPAELLAAFTELLTKKETWLIPVGVRLSAGGGSRTDT